VIGEDDWDSLVCASKYQEGYGYTGRIAFVTEAGGRWYLAPPHPHHYRVLGPCRVEQAVVAFLGQRRAGGGRAADGGGESAVGLARISYEEYQEAVVRGRV
jgi:hypothetical protein